MQFKVSIVALLSASILAACSGNDNVTEDEASEGWQVASEPLRKGQEKIMSKVDSEGVAAILGDNSVTATVDCEDGGETRLELSAEFDGGDVNIDFPATFDDCTALQIIVNGELAIGSPDNFGYSEMAPPSGDGSDGTGGSGDGSSGGSQPVTITYEGDIDFAGDADGPCEVDMTVETGSGQPTYSGTLCGYDADNILGFGF